MCATTMGRVSVSREFMKDEAEKFELAAKSHWLHFLPPCRCFSSFYSLHNAAGVLYIMSSMAALHAVCNLDSTHLFWCKKCAPELFWSWIRVQMRLLRTSSATGSEWKTPTQKGWAGTFAWPNAATNKNVEHVAVLTGCVHTPAVFPTMVRLCVCVWVCIMTKT